MSLHTHPPSPDIDDAIAAMALGGPGALAADESLRVASALLTCPACREQLADLQRVANGIGLSLEGTDEDVDLPAGLRDRIVSAAQATPNAAPRTVPFRPSPPISEQPRASTAFGWLAIAASLVMIGAMSWYVMMSHQQAADASNQRLAADVRAAALQKQVSSLQDRINIMSAADVVKVDLLAQPDAPGSSARVFMSPKRGMVLTAEHLPALAAGRTYQLWVVTKQAPVSVGVFTVLSDGSVAGVMPLSADATLNPVAIAVTIEPEGGVPSPTGPKVLVGVLATQ